MMDNMDYLRQYDALKAEAKHEVKNLMIKYHGQCPQYKGHFDLRSCVVGALLTAIFFVIAIAVYFK